MDYFNHNPPTTLFVDQPEWMDDEEWTYREELVEKCSAAMKSLGHGFPLAVVDPLVRFLKGELDQDELAQHFQHRQFREFH